MSAEDAIASVDSIHMEMTMRLTERDSIDVASGSPDAQRLLVLLTAATDNTLMLDELRDRDVTAPAQAAYELQLGGYIIERVTPKDEHALGYRLHTRPQASP
jgi:hypothetical protein